MKTLVLTAVLIGVVGAVSIFTLRARAEDMAASQRIAYAAMSLPRFPETCSPAARLATNSLCTIQ